MGRGVSIPGGRNFSDFWNQKEELVPNSWGPSHRYSRPEPVAGAGHAASDGSAPPRDAAQGPVIARSCSSDATTSRMVVGVVGAVRRDRACGQEEDGEDGREGRRRQQPEAYREDGRGAHRRQGPPRCQDDASDAPSAGRAVEPIGSAATRRAHHGRRAARLSTREVACSRAVIPGNIRRRASLPGNNAVDFPQRFRRFDRGEPAPLAMSGNGPRSRPSARFVRGSVGSVPGGGGRRWRTDSPVSYPSAVARSSGLWEIQPL
jgi:hypothetical protein